MRQQMRGSALCGRILGATAVAGVLLIAPAISGQAAKPAAQGLGATDTYYIKGMLKSAYEAVKLHYYDPAFHGLDWDARYRQFDDKLKLVSSVDEGQMVVAAFLDGLHDSHTYFRPPARSFDVDYGYLMSLIGDAAFITHVRPGTDAAAKAQPGDRVVAVNGYEIDRDGFLKMQYILNALAPRTATELRLSNAAGIERTVTVTSTVRKKRIARLLTNGNEITAVERQQEDAARGMRQQHREIGDVMIWKMPVFLADISEIDRLFTIARKHAALIVDLRGNPGGRMDVLARMLGNLFDRDVPIATRKGRAGSKVFGAPTRGGNAYAGRLVVLVDSESGSAAELFARVIQLEHRGVVVGDRSAGAVMEALVYPFELGNDALLYYAISVTDADLVMRDGQSLERVGVSPDEPATPSAEDLGSGRDPVLAKAAQLAGLRLDPASAGKLFPFEWRPF